MPRSRVNCASNAALLLVFAGLLLGCSRGDGRVPVTGRVLIDGKPLSHGDVIVAPSGERPAFGKLDSEGRFVLTTTTPGDGTVLGTHAVAIRAMEFVDQFHRQWHAPKKYADAATSSVTLTVDGPTDDAKIELSWGGGQPFVETIQGAGQ